MAARPTSVTVVAWILIVLTVISLGSSLFMTNNPNAREIMAKTPIPIVLQFVLLYLGLAINLVCGVGVLMGSNWARVLYAVWGVFSFGLNFAVSPMKVVLLPSLVVFGLILFFLFRPAATAYFTAPTEATLGS